MCFIQFEYFVCAHLFLYLTHINTINSTISGDSAPLNSSEEIKDILRSTSVFNQSSESIFKGLRAGNFAEGGLVSNNTMTTHFPLTTKNHGNNFYSHNNISVDEHQFTGKKNNSSLSSSVLDKEDKNNLSLTLSSIKASLATKLSETGTNLFLGAPEVVHINGTSSIKPRKGVYYNKIVPRKGVFNDNETNHSLSLNDSCFWVSEEECYSTLDFNDIECKCCKEGNSIGRVIKQQSLLNCDSCKPINSNPLGMKLSCQNICCSNMLLSKESYSVATTEDFLDENFHKTTPFNESKTKNVFEIQKAEIKKGNSNFYKKIVIEKNKKLKNLTKKTKPVITKVPYDVEIFSKPINKTSKEVFLPIVVSIFLLPLLGILLFVIWKKINEFWENRYYKRMDFLIDGMYND